MMIFFAGSVTIGFLIAFLLARVGVLVLHRSARYPPRFSARLSRRYEMTPGMVSQVSHA